MTLPDWMDMDWDDVRGWRNVSLVETKEGWPGRWIWKRRGWRNLSEVGDGRGVGLAGNPPAGPGSTSLQALLLLLLVVVVGGGGGGGGVTDWKQNSIGLWHKVTNENKPGQFTQHSSDDNNNNNNNNNVHLSCAHRQRGPGRSHDRT